MSNTENNKLIVNFMGLKPIEWNGRYSISKDHCTCNDVTYEDAINGFCSITKYDTDWNWLMQVVEKSLTMGDNTDQWDNILNELQSVNIENVYNACVEFIKWYNNNNLNPIN